MGNSTRQALRSHFVLCFFYPILLHTQIEQCLFSMAPYEVLSKSYQMFTFCLLEVLCDPSLAPKLADTKAAGEVKALDDFYQMLQNDPDRAYYG